MCRPDDSACREARTAGRPDDDTPERQTHDPAGRPGRRERPRPHRDLARLPAHAAAAARTAYSAPPRIEAAETAPAVVLVGCSTGGTGGHRPPRVPATPAVTPPGRAAGAVLAAAGIGLRRRHRRRHVPGAREPSPACAVARVVPASRGRSGARPRGPARPGGRRATRRPHRRTAPARRRDGARSRGGRARDRARRSGRRRAGSADGADDGAPTARARAPALRAGAAPRRDLATRGAVPGGERHPHPRPGDGAAPQPRGGRARLGVRTGRRGEPLRAGTPRAPPMPRPVRVAARAFTQGMARHDLARRIRARGRGGVVHRQRPAGRAPPLGPRVHTAHALPRRPRHTDHDRLAPAHRAPAARGA